MKKRARLEGAQKTYQQKKHTARHHTVLDDGQADQREKHNGVGNIEDVTQRTGGGKAGSTRA